MKNDINSWEGWHFHHLVRRAKIFGLNKKLIHNLERVGWELTKNGSINDSPITGVITSLEELASIKDFDKTCEDLNCTICKKVVDNFKTCENTEDPWKLSGEPYRWQKEAKKVWWENNCKGIVKVVTGAGKTVFSLSLISDLFNLETYKNGGLKTIIIVPTTVLLDQWLIELNKRLNIPRNEIGIFYGKEKEKLLNKKIIIYVINSARTHLEEHFQRYYRDQDLFLIADECHRYGSKENSKIFNVPFSYTLGLSATPERYGDYGFEEKIIPNLGNVIYYYSYSDALKDGIIPPYKISKIKVNLSNDEKAEYDEFTEKIRKINNLLTSKYPYLKGSSPDRFIKNLKKVYEKTGDKTILNYTSLLNRRKSIIHLSKSKLIALKWLFDKENLYNDKVLIFHERIEIAEIIWNYLEKRNLNTSLYHSEMKLEKRFESISKFKEGRSNILIACKALDEGFDVPNADTGIIVAGTSSIRQWIQRMGRILRKSPGKEYSKIYLIFAEDVEKDIFTESELEEFEKEALSVESIKLSINK